MTATPLAIGAGVRHHTITPDVSWLRGERETVYLLRCYGPGAGVIGEGRRNTFRDLSRAIDAGRIWDADGISPADQRDDLSTLNRSGLGMLADMPEAA